MNVDEGTLIEAIKAYAILHDRPYWYDPDRLVPQAKLWRRLIGMRAEDGLVIGGDFMAAEDRLLRLPGTDEYQEYSKPTLALRDISPVHVIDQACELAARRRERAAKAVRYPDNVLYTERGMWHSARQGQEPDLADEFGEIDPDVTARVMAERIAHADQVFVGQVESLIYDLLNSGLSDSQTTPLIADLRTRLTGSGLVPDEEPPSLG